MCQGCAPLTWLGLIAGAWLLYPRDAQRDGAAPVFFDLNMLSALPECGRGGACTERSCGALPGISTPSLRSIF